MSLNGKVLYKRALILEVLDFDIGLAYWISPSGLIKNVKNTHIKDVISAPEEFGLTVGYIKSVYNENNEGVGLEGNARDKIINRLVGEGWIRIRCYYSEGYYSVDINYLKGNSREYLSQWASKLIEADDRCKEFIVKINLYNRGIEECKLSELLESGYLGDTGCERVSTWLVPLRDDEWFSSEIPIIRMQYKIKLVEYLKEK